MFVSRSVIAILLVGALACTALLPAGCDRDRPIDLIDEETYMDILLELHILAAIREIDGEDETRYKAGQDAVLAHYNISRDQFQRSNDYYHRNMQEQQLRYSTIRLRLDELSSELSERYFKLREAQEAETEAPDETEHPNESEVLDESEVPDETEHPNESEVPDETEQP